MLRPVGSLPSPPGLVFVPRTRQWSAIKPRSISPALSSSIDREVRKSGPYSFYKCGKGFSANSGARGGEKIRQIRRFAESDKELARFYRENA